MISPGATVSEGQAVMELETDKAVVEVPSTVSGVVQEVRVKEGQKIKVGQVIFTFENGTGEKAKAPEPKAQQTAAAAASAATATGQPPKKDAQPTPPPRSAAPLPPPPASDRRVGTSAGAGRTEFKLPELGENISQGDLVRLMIS